MKTVLVVGIDMVRRKNLYQFQGLAAYGYRFVVCAWDATDESYRTLGATENVELPATGRGKLLFVRRLLSALRRYPVALAELYPYSFFALGLALLLRSLGVPVLVIARGQEWLLLRKELPLLRRVALRLTYRMASGVLYKEPYMEPLFRHLPSERRWLLPNAIDLPPQVNVHSIGKCHFLYLNSIRSVRHPEIAIDAFLRLCERMNLNASSSVRLAIVGLRGKTGVHGGRQQEQRLHEMIEGKDVPIELHPWTNQPERWLDDADVFLLPADVVFLNYALLEAMGRAMPAIVQNAPDAERIVTNGVDGYVLPRDPSVWYLRMTRLVEDCDLRRSMGMAARAKVAKHFTNDIHVRSYAAVYAHLSRKGRQ